VGWLGEPEGAGVLDIRVSPKRLKREAHLFGERLTPPLAAQEGFAVLGQGGKTHDSKVEAGADAASDGKRLGDYESLRTA